MIPPSPDSGQAFLGPLGLVRGQGTGGGQWGGVVVSNESISQLEQEKGSGSAQPTPVLPSPSHPSSPPPSSVLFS